jgi:hypothetical protein
LLQIEGLAADLAQAMAELRGGEFAQETTGYQGAQPGMAGAQIGGGAEVTLAGESGDQGAAGGGLGEVGLRVRESGAAEGFAMGRVFQQGG